MVIYKIIDTATWNQASAKGRFDGASIDLTDGYIHFSTAKQVQETADKHFAGQTDLLLISIESGRLGDQLRWEPSRGGQLFPHLYGHLSMDAVISADEIKQDKTGRHILPIAE